MSGMTLIHYGKGQYDFVLSYDGSPQGYLVEKKTRRIVSGVSNGMAVVKGKVCPIWKLLGYYSPHEFHNADNQFLKLQIARGLNA